MQTPNAPNGRGKSKLLRIFLAILLTPILVFAICEALGWPFLRVPFEHFASKQLQRTVRIAEPFQLRLIGGVSLKVGGLWISAPPGFDAPHFVSTNKADLKLRYADLYQLKHSDLLRIKSLEVDQIDARLIRHPDGQAIWNFQHDPNRPPRPFPTIEKLIATKGHAEVVDAINEADLKVDFNTNEGSANTKSASSIRAVGTYRQKPLKAELATDGFLPVATRDKTAPPIQSKGWADYASLHLDFDGAVSDLLGRRNIDGKFSAHGPSLSIVGNFTGTVLPVTDKFALSGTVKKTDEVWNVNVAAAHVGQSDLAGKFRYDPSPPKPSLKGELRGKRLYLADVFPAFGTRREDGTVVKPPKGKIIADRPLDLPSLNKMDAQVIVRLDYVDLGTLFARPISPFNADLSMDKGKLALAKIDAHVAEGSLAGLISIDAYQAAETSPAAPPKWQIDLQWKNIDLEKWLKVSEDRKRQAKKKGEKDIPPAYVTGSLNGRTKLSGHGKSTRELLASLDGDVSLFIRKGTISHLLIELMGIDLAQSLGIILTRDEPLRMQCAVIDLDTRNGTARPQVALIDTNITLVLIDGNIVLPEEELNLRLTAKPRNVSPFTLRSPIRVRGTFLNPDVAPEKGPIAARVAGGAVLAFINPLAAIIPFVDLGSTNNEPSPCKQTLARFSKPSR